MNGSGKPVVAIAGRPNVGKSTLFNRLVGARQAIVEDVPGTTRDRLYGEVEWAGRSFTLIDTGGLDLGTSGDVPASIANQVRVAVEEADLILLCVDAVAGLTPADTEVAQLLRQGAAPAGSRAGWKAAAKPVLVVAGKADNASRRDAAAEFYALGFDDVIPVSALHGSNSGDLLDAIVERLPAPPEMEDEPDDRLKLAIVGRPNVGKSSLLNKLLGEERVVVSDTPGTTRDAIDTEIEHQGRRLVLIDTAGIRRPGRIEPGVERYSVLRSMRAIDRCDVAVLVVDATDPMTAQDVHLAGEIEARGKGAILAVNKWDLVEKTSTTMREFRDKIARDLRFAPWVPVHFISALTGQRVQRLLDEALAVEAERQKRIPTHQLNDVISRVLAARPPASRHGRPLKLYYATQADVIPPTFIFFVNDTDLVHFSFERAMENTLRAAFGFAGTAIRLRFRRRTSDRDAAGASASPARSARARA